MSGNMAVNTVALSLVSHSKDVIDGTHSDPHHHSLHSLTGDSNNVEPFTPLHVMSLEERTLVVRNFCPQVTRELLHELFLQAGPVIKVVARQDFAFIEFEHKESVAYALALLRGIHLFGRELHLEPRIRAQQYYKYSRDLDHFEHVMALNPEYFVQFTRE